MIRSSTRAGAALVAGLALLLAGCSGSDSDSEGTAASASPLEQYFSQLGGGEDDPAAQAAVQEAVAACMTEQGFDYEPDVNSVTSFSSDSLDVEWGSEEFAKTYGYGISTDPYGMNDDDGGVADDPNADYLASLSESERIAYDEALWGAGSVDPEAEYDWKTAGCMGAAQHDAEEGKAFWEDPAYLSISEEMGELSTKADAAPGVVAVLAKWTSCMADAAFDEFESPQDAQQGISAEYSDLLSPPADRPDDAPEMSAPAPGTSVTSIGGDVDPVALKALQEREIAMAVADFGCAESSGYDDAVKEEQRRLEQEFVDRNRSTLDALVAEYGSR